MDKSFWGPSTWCMIHTSAVGYKREFILSYKQFIYSLPYLLPCEYCRNHLTHNLSVLPLTNNTLKSNRNLFVWTYFLHDLVNKQLHKPSSPPYNLVEKHYFSNIDNNNFWGPCFWRVIHSVAASYRPEEKVKEAFKQFIISLSGIIPCEVSRQRYTKYLSQLPLTEEILTSNTNLFWWTYFLHDLINKDLGKISPPFEDVKSQYFNEHVCKSCGV
jgi:hypothetical protein